ncbi:MAG: STAS domain-containing protein [Salinivirgaceae bacterium]|nr:STAS domain-containing protein [Salinivirgaceae bacterium]MDD4746768.1 STAS domain-containing protein [Salinivirgaceae bacterium]MDY0280626.1 STAS domain-containing protein [Salinivirgaceae bacterium]
MFETEIIDGIPIIKGVNTQKINALNSEDFKVVLKNNLANNKAIIINFLEIRYIDSTGFSVLLSVFDQAKKSDKRMLLVNISPEVTGLFKITKLNKVFDLYPTLNDAIKTLQ